MGIELIGDKRKWQALFEDAEEAVTNWQKTNSKATFTEIENAVAEEMARVRAQMMVEVNRMHLVQTIPGEVSPI